MLRPADFPEKPAVFCVCLPYPVVTAMNFINSSAVSSGLRPGGAAAGVSGTFTLGGSISAMISSLSPVITLYQQAALRAKPERLEYFAQVHAYYVVLHAHHNALFAEPHHGAQWRRYPETAFGGKAGLEVIS